MNGPAGHKEKEEPSDDSMSEDEFIAKLLRESIGEEDEDMPPAADDVVETEDAEEEPEDITDDILGDTDTEGYDYEDPEE